jgi:O-antigen ligase
MTRLVVVAQRVLFGTLLLVLFTSPFEVGYPPLGKVLWTTYTNLEAALFLLGAAWLFLMIVDAGARRRLLRLPLLLPMLVLIGACVVSTLFGEYKSLGIQFIYRLLMGMLVFAAAWEALRGRRRMLIGVGTFVAAGTVAASIGLLEFLPWINLEPWLEVFKPQPTTVGGMLRLSGTFEYANGAAAYSEMVLPLLLGLIILFASARLVSGLLGEGRLSERRRVAVCVLLYVALAAMTMALILTFSRAAWFGVVVALAVFIVVMLARRRASKGETVSPVGIQSLALAMAVMALGVVYIYLTHPLLVLRLGSENDRDWYNNTISVGTMPTIYAGEYVTVPVTVRNEGPMLWKAERSPFVHLSYHWRQEGKADYVIFDGVRSRLPRDVGPNESVTVQAVVAAPPKPGTYVLEWDLVQEDVAWFFQKSRSRTASASYEVRPSTGRPPAPIPPSTTFPRVSVADIENYDTSTIPRAQLWKAAFAMFLDHPITGVGPDGFRNLYGRYAGKTEWNRNIYTNSTYIEMFTNLGLLGGFAFLWLVGLALWRAARNLLREHVDASWMVALGATAALVAFLVHGFVDYFLFSTPLYIAFWFVMATSVCWTTVGRQVDDGR